VTLDQVLPPLVVATPTAGPLGGGPTATQSLTELHDTAERLLVPEGNVSVVHITPASFVATTSPLGEDPEPQPTAVHLVLELQEMPVSSTASLGSDTQFHVVPPSVVTSA
jgi:hypothetical protein